MIQQYQHDQFTDDQDRPAGGRAQGVGIDITWQNGPLGAPDDPNRAEPNGAFVETILRIACDRLEFYQRSPFVCAENAYAISCLHSAMQVLETRTARRTIQGVEGTHEGN